MKHSKKKQDRRIYIYIDVPVFKYQINQIFPKKLKHIKNLIFINTSELNFKKDQLMKHYKNVSKKEVPENTIFIKKFDNFRILAKKIKSSDIFIFYNYSFSLKNSKFPFLEIFNKIKCKKILMEQHSWIYPNFKKNILFNSFRLLRFLINKIINKNNNRKIKTDYILSYGEQLKNKFVNYNAKHLDYPSFWIKFYSKLPPKKFITYVDETFHYSGDQFLTQKNHTKKIDNLNNYLIKLNHFFSLVEKKFKRKIVICCKKKFNYNKNYFNGRKIVYGKTLEYITKSKLVIGHKSDALIQAIYSKSPVILLRSREFSLKRNLEINSKSINWFNKKSIFFEDYYDKKKKLDVSVDKKYYSKILNNYFISNNLIKMNFHEKLNLDLKSL